MVNVKDGHVTSLLVARDHHAFSVALLIILYGARDQLLLKSVKYLFSLFFINIPVFSNYLLSYIEPQGLDLSQNITVFGLYVKNRERQKMVN